MLVFSARRSLPQADDWAVSYPRQTVEHCLVSRLLGWFLLEDDDHRIVRGKYKGREGKATQVYRKKWVINRLLASITRSSLSLPAALSSLLSTARLPPSSTTLPKSLVKPESRIKSGSNVSP
ncbi:hypothetical protein EV715DRAFT_297992 [Schizophyllum commune]